MSVKTVIGLLAGIGLLGVLALTNDLAAIFHQIGEAGWGMALVVVSHPLAAAFSAAGWYVLLPRRQGIGPSRFMLYRWIREGVNALLPVAQVGGDVVRARLIALDGVDVTDAAASVTVDLLMEVATQLLFTLLGIALLLEATGRDAVALQFGWLISGTVLAGLAVAGFFLSQRFGLTKLIERALIKLADKTGWTALGGVRGLNDAIIALYRAPGRLLLSAASHLGSWFAGVVETYLALQVLGLGTGSVTTAVILESLGQAARAIGFAVPGAVGIQEGGYALICAAMGIGADEAIALSLTRRIRDLALGLPALLAWRQIERHQRRQRTDIVAVERQSS